MAHAPELVFLPILGAIADYPQRKKQMLATFASLGAFATLGLYFVEGASYLLGLALLTRVNVAQAAHEAGNEAPARA